MELYSAGLWYPRSDPDRIDPYLFPSLQRRPGQSPQAYIEHLAHVLHIRPRGESSMMDEMMARPRVVLCGAESEVEEVDAWLIVLGRQGAIRRGEIPPPKPGPYRCCMHPWCPNQQQAQTWCMDCWNRIHPSTQRGLVATYQDQQGFTGDTRKWMEWAKKTPSLRSP